MSDRRPPGRPGATDNVGGPRTPPRGYGDPTAGLRDRLVALFRAPDYKPPTLPRIALEMLELTRRPDVSFAKLNALLETDPMLAGQVLRVVQSPAYAGAVPIRTLEQATSRLGLLALRDVVWEVSFTTRILKAKSHAAVLDAIRRRSVLVATAARTIANARGLDAEYAFLCGLLHDIGRAGMIIALSERGESIDLSPGGEAWRAMSAVNQEASAVIAEIWGLPEEIRQVIGNQRGLDTQESPSPIAAVLAVAEEMVARATVTSAPMVSAVIDPRPLAELRAAQAILGMDDAALAQAEREVSRLASLID